MAVVAYLANVERNPPRFYLSALEWAPFGNLAPKGAAALGDELVLQRAKGGGHVGLYVGHDASAFHVLGGNQIERLPPNAALERVMLDYAKLRDQARACAYRFRQNVPDKTGILNFANGRARWRW